MVKIPLPRIGRRKTGKVSIHDGEFKMVIKERARLIGVVTTFFMGLGVIIAFIAPYLLLVMGGLWIFTTILMSGLLDTIVWSGRKITDFIRWTGKWCIKQPINDFRYGRKKRKQLEDKRTYSE